MAKLKYFLETIFVEKNIRFLKFEFFQKKQTIALKSIIFAVIKTDKALLNL